MPENSDSKDFDDEDKLKKKLLLLKKKICLSHEVIQKYNDALMDIDRLKRDLLSTKNELAKITTNNNTNMAKNIELQLDNDKLKKNISKLEQIIEENKTKMNADRRHIHQLTDKVKNQDVELESTKIDCELKIKEYTEKIAELNKKSKCPKDKKKNFLEKSVQTEVETCPVAINKNTEKDTVKERQKRYCDNGVNTDPCTEIILKKDCEDKCTLTDDTDMMVTMECSFCQICNIKINMEICSLCDINNKLMEGLIPPVADLIGKEYELRLKNESAKEDRLTILEQRLKSLEKKMKKKKKPIKQESVCCFHRESENRKQRKRKSTSIIKINSTSKRFKSTSFSEWVQSPASDHEQTNDISNIDDHSFVHESIQTEPTKIDSISKCDNENRVKSPIRNPEDELMEQINEKLELQFVEKLIQNQNCASTPKPVITSQTIVYPPFSLNINKSDEEVKKIIAVNDITPAELTIEKTLTENSKKVENLEKAVEKESNLDKVEKVVSADKEIKETSFSVKESVVSADKEIEETSLSVIEPVVSADKVIEEMSSSTQEPVVSANKEREEVSESVIISVSVVEELNDESNTLIKNSNSIMINERSDMNYVAEKVLETIINEENSNMKKVEDISKETCAFDEKSDEEISSAEQTMDKNSENTSKSFSEDNEETQHVLDTKYNSDDCTESDSENMTDTEIDVAKSLSKHKLLTNLFGDDSEAEMNDDSEKSCHEDVPDNTKSDNELNESTESNGSDAELESPQSPDGLEDNDLHIENLAKSTNYKAPEIYPVFDECKNDSNIKQLPAEIITNEDDKDENDTVKRLKSKSGLLNKFINFKKGSVEDDIKGSKIDHLTSNMSKSSTEITKLISERNTVSVEKLISNVTNKVTEKSVPQISCIGTKPTKVVSETFTTSVEKSISHACNKEIQSINPKTSIASNASIEKIVPETSFENTEKSVPEINTVQNKMILPESSTVNTESTPSETNITTKETSDTDSQNEFEGDLTSTNNHLRGTKRRAAVKKPVNRQKSILSKLRKLKKTDNITNARTEIKEINSEADEVKLSKPKVLPEVADYQPKKQRIAHTPNAMDEKIGNKIADNNKLDKNEKETTSELPKAHIAISSIAKVTRVTRISAARAVKTIADKSTKKVEIKPAVTNPEIVSTIMKDIEKSCKDLPTIKKPPMELRSVNVKKPVTPKKAAVQKAKVSPKKLADKKVNIEKIMEKEDQEKDEKNEDPMMKPVSLETIANEIVEEAKLEEELLFISKCKKKKITNPLPFGDYDGINSKEEVGVNEDAVKLNMEEGNNIKLDENGEVPTIYWRLKKYILNSDKFMSGMKKRTPTEKRQIKFAEGQVHRLVNDKDWSMEVHEAVIKKLTDHCTSEHIVHGIVNYIATNNMKESVDTTYSPPAPIMTKSQQKIVTLVYSLEKHYPNIFKELQSLIEFTLFKFDSAPTFGKIEAFAAVYVSLARIKKDRAKVRLFCVDALYCYNLKAAAVIYIALRNWPEIMPIYGTMNDKLALCIMMIVMNINSNYGKLKILKQLMLKYYQYPAAGISSLNFVQICLADITAKPEEHTIINTALILLAKKESHDWVYKNIIINLKHMIVHKMHPSPFAAYDLLGNVLRCFPLDDNEDIVKNTIKQLCDVLDASAGTHQEQEAMARALLCLNRHDFSAVSKCILKWRPTETLRPDTIEKLRVMFQNRRVRQWKTIAKQPMNTQAKSVDKV